MVQHTDIRDGGTLDYDDAFFEKGEADALLAQIRAETPWQQERSRMGPFPRLTAWYADAGLTYSYSGVTHQAIAWTPTLREIRRRVEDWVGQTFLSAGSSGRQECLPHAISFNSLLLNYYRHGQDSIGYHTDAEPELGVNPVIASISLGAVRQFVLKHIKTGEKLKFDLAHGSLLLMGGTCQHHWMHELPKTKAPVGERINLTFRRIVTTR